MYVIFFYDFCKDLKLLGCCFAFKRVAKGSATAVLDGFNNAI